MQENGINNVKIRRAIFSLYGMRLTNIVCYYIVNKEIVFQFAAISNKKVTVTKFICMLPQVVSWVQAKVRKKVEFYAAKRKKTQVLRRGEYPYNEGFHIHASLPCR